MDYQKKKLHKDRNIAKSWWDLVLEIGEAKVSGGLLLCNCLEATIVDDSQHETEINNWYTSPWPVDQNNARTFDRKDIASGSLILKLCN